MHRIFPEPVEDVEVGPLYAAAPRPEPPGRPWVMLNMVASADGAATAEGRSGGLGSSGDRAAFFALRAAADVIMAAAGTVRIEGYGPARLNAEAQAERGVRGQAPLPRIAVVTGSLRLDWDSPLFAESAERPYVITAADAPAEALARAGAVAEVIATGDGGRVDLADALARLGRAGARLVLCEGGPSLNGALLRAGLVDELNLTVAPALAGGEAIRIVRGEAPEASTPLRLAHVLEEHGSLFLRYVRA